MANAKTGTLRRCAGWGMGAVFVASLAVWFVTRDTLPGSIRIATGVKGGLYHGLADKMGRALERRTGHAVKIVETDGSVDNLDRLLSEGGDRVDLAILQGGAVRMDKVAVLAPLYPEVVHVLVRRGLMSRALDLGGIRSISDLRGKRVSLGPPRSGMRRSALKVLGHYGLTASDFEDTKGYFLKLLDEEGDRPSLDAAIVTTGMENPDLQAVLETGDFAILPIDGAKAIEMKQPYFEAFEIPRGLYVEGPATRVPLEDVSTLSTTAFLAARRGAPARLVKEALASLYDEGLALDFPVLFPRKAAAERTPHQLHPAARSYYEPIDSLGWLANVMESLAATKELLFTFGAGLYLLWDRWRRLKERERQALLRAQKERLDTFLDKTLAIERAQMQTTDPAHLQGYLDDVTRIKLAALAELSHEGLRGDQTFAIFLTQCANLIGKIQMKIMTQATRSRTDKSTKIG